MPPLLLKVFGVWAGVKIAPAYQREAVDSKASRNRPLLRSGAFPKGLAAQASWKSTKGHQRPFWRLFRCSPPTSSRRQPLEESCEVENPNQQKYAHNPGADSGEYIHDGSLCFFYC